MLALETTLDRPATATLAERGFALAKKWGPYVVAVLLPGGSLIALGLWLYSRYKNGTSLLPFSIGAVASGLRAAVGWVPGLDLPERGLRSREQRLDVPVAGMALRSCTCGGERSL